MRASPTCTSHARWDQASSWTRDPDKALTSLGAFLHRARRERSGPSALSPLHVPVFSSRPPDAGPSDAELAASGVPDTSPTWELELLISGAVLFALFRVSDRSRTAAVGDSVLEMMGIAPGPGAFTAKDAKDAKDCLTKNLWFCSPSRPLRLKRTNDRWSCGLCGPRRDHSNSKWR